MINKRVNERKYLSGCSVSLILQLLLIGRAIPVSMGFNNAMMIQHSSPLRPKPHTSISYQQHHSLKRTQTIHNFVQHIQLGATSPQMASQAENNTENEIQPKSLKEDEVFIAAVQEVKYAAKNVTSSSAQFTSAIVSKGPSILWRIFAAFVDVEIRYVIFFMSAVKYLLNQISLLIFFTLLYQKKRLSTKKETLHI